MNLKSTTFSDSSQPQQLTDLMNPLTRHMWKVGFFEMENRAVVVKDWKWKWSCSVVSDSLRSHGPWPARLLHPWDSPGKSTGVGCHFLLQGIFPTHGLNLGLPDCRQMLYHLSHQGSQSTSEYMQSICRVYHVKCQTGWSTNWNQDCQEKYQ